MEFLKSPGGCVVSNNIINKKGDLKWCVREKSLNKADNGWRFLSDIDTEEFLNSPANMSVWDFNTIAEIEPAILLIYNMPIGTDITLNREDGKIFFTETSTGKKVRGVLLPE
jgi:Uncharacterized protein conserved in bacteria